METVEKQTVEEWRFERFRDLKFTEKEAAILRDARDTKGFHVYVGEIERLLDKGCSHKHVIRIVA